MRGGTLFSGIGAPEQAMPWVDWRWCAEVDNFACAVMAARHPRVTNLGDVNGVDWDDIARTEPVDLLVFGSPCQSFSLAGRRRGFCDPRGNLALVALGVVQVLQPAFFLFENVPGLLSSSGGQDFGACLGQVEECGYGWAYRVLNAQFFGVPQRRRRLFLVGYRDPVSGVGDWRIAASILFDRPGVFGHPSPRRKTRAAVARAVTASTGGCSAKEQQLTFVDGDGRPLNALCFGGGNTSGEIDVATCLTRHHTRQDFDTETFAVVGPLCSHSAQHGHAMTTQQAAEAGHVVAHPLAFDCKRDGRGANDVAPTLRAMGHDAGHANAGGQVAVAYPLDLRNAGRDANRHGGVNRQGCGVGDADAPAPACTTGPVAGVAYAFQPRIGRSGRGQPSEIVPALGGASAGAGATSDSRPCVAVSLKLDNGSAQPIGGVEIAPTIRQGAGPNGTANVGVFTRYAVRRLTPRECERLQGFCDDYTLIEYRGKPAADGPRYRALGNSMAVPVVAWIGRRIEMADRLIAELRRRATSDDGDTHNERPGLVEQAGAPEAA